MSFGDPSSFESIPDSIGAVACVARIVAVNQPDQSVPNGAGGFTVVAVPAIASLISYRVQVFTPNGYFIVDNVVPNGDRPDPPFYCRPASVDSWWPAFMVGDNYVFCIGERELAGPCSGTSLPPPTTTTPANLEPNTISPFPLNPRLIPARPDLPMGFT